MTKETQFKKLIEIGLEIESQDNNTRFIGHTGITDAGIKKEIKKLRLEGYAIVNDLQVKGIDPYETKYSYTFEGVEFDLDYSMQFI